jgi:very-short-patch-repair endonuclease
MNYNQTKGKKIQACFNKIVLSWKSKEDILSLYKEGYTPRALFCMLENDKIVNWKTLTWDWKGIQKLAFENGMNGSIFSKRLKKIVPYRKEHHLAFLEADEWIKSGHKTSMPKEEWEQWRLSKSREGAKETQLLRKSWEHYNPKNEPSYYTGTDEAKRQKAFQHRRSKSPMTQEFWLKRGLSPDEANEWIRCTAAKGGIAACESLYSKCTSKLEQRVFDELSGKFEIVQQLRIQNRFFDIACTKTKRIVEIDGTYWHCDPRVYKATFLHVSGRTAQEIWKRDKDKQRLAESHGWTVYRVKELSICKDYNKALQLIKNFLSGD